MSTDTDEDNDSSVEKEKQGIYWNIWGHTSNSRVKNIQDNCEKAYK